MKKLFVILDQLKPFIRSGIIKFRYITLKRLKENVLTVSNEKPINSNSFTFTFPITLPTISADSIDPKPLGRIHIPLVNAS